MAAPVSVSVVDVDVENRKVVFHIGNHWEPLLSLEEHLDRLTEIALAEIKRRGGLVSAEPS